jgi:hypothetical protein
MLKNNIIINIEATSFGDIVDFAMPENTTAVILCYNEGYGLRPFDLCLPHQVYVKKLQKKLKENPLIRSFTIIPMNNEHYIGVDLELIKEE